MSSNWSMSEDVQLCISYCRQSIDPITGARQKVKKLWEKVHTDFQANWVMGEDKIITTNPRSHSALQSSYAKLKPNLVLWGSCISYAKRNPKSGYNLQDEIRKAQVLYVAKRKKTCIHFDCWEQVNNHPTVAIIEATTPFTHIKQVQ
ncbi:hypothetical protein QQ045_008653 [Rhodiola kirilowii]